MEENTQAKGLDEKDAKKPSINWSVQDFLSLGYLYLLLVGIVGDSIYYSYLGVNILSYSTIIDVILSPVSTMIEVPMLGVMLLCIPLVFGGMIMLQKRAHLNNRDKPEYRAKHDIEKLDKSFSNKGIRTGLIIATMMAIFSGFIGFGWGGGNKMKERMEAGEFESNTIVQFIGGESKRVRLIGHNSEYLFFVEEGKRKLSIAPIPGNVNSIREMDSEEKEAAKSESD